MAMRAAAIVMRVRIESTDPAKAQQGRTLAVWKCRMVWILNDPGRAGLVRGRGSGGRVRVLCCRRPGWDSPVQYGRQVGVTLVGSSPATISPPACTDTLTYPSPIIPPPYTVARRLRSGRRHPDRPPVQQQHLSRLENHFWESFAGICLASRRMVRSISCRSPPSCCPSLLLRSWSLLVPIGALRLLLDRDLIASILRSLSSQRARWQPFSLVTLASRVTVTVTEFESTTTGSCLTRPTKTNVVVGGPVYPDTIQTILGGTLVPRAPFLEIDTETNRHGVAPWYPIHGLIMLAKTWYIVGPIFLENFNLTSIVQQLRRVYHSQIVGEAASGSRVPRHQMRLPELFGGRLINYPCDTDLRSDVMPRRGDSDGVRSSKHRTRQQHIIIILQNIREQRVQRAEHGCGETVAGACVIGCEA
ncbi:uncharacterized protein LY89DRAFT_665402 [Mollisia scopiformis]|uniref:Uncharacterized protein n=1 Tax=Mollisia scopiformis TaxID=149040 RepID=A0A194XL15_MOLSC|nr:uncharacterized protein LY89DRAFT_665402 [Mollisia scopiformis]KUJ20925.1 hypothetical protein LY89DRAFT_665402 [Mollisia scopiformis]